MEPENKNEVLVWQKDTWGSYGQHSNVYTFVVDLETLTTSPIFQHITVRHENKDSRKNVHRYTYAKKEEILSKLKGKILKQVYDYASSSKREVSVTYYFIGDDFQELSVERGLRDNQGFYDKVKLPNNKVLIVRKDKLEIVNQ